MSGMLSIALDKHLGYDWPTNEMKNLHFNAFHHDSPVFSRLIQSLLYTTNNTIRYNERTVLVARHTTNCALRHANDDQRRRVTENLSVELTTLAAFSWLSYLMKMTNIDKTIHKITRSIWKMLGPFATASRRTPPVLHRHSPGVVTVARRLRIDVHNNIDNDNNDNAWQRGPLRPHGMGPIKIASLFEEGCQKGGVEAVRATASIMAAHANPFWRPSSRMSLAVSLFFC